MMRQMTSRTRCGSHSHLSCVTTIEAFVKPTHVWTLFFLVHTLCAGSLQFLVFSAVRKRFFGRGQSNIIFASDITE